MHEIITLQLGQRSNYLATHFWNLQESYFSYDKDEEVLIDHDVHFRAGIGVGGTETYTPRTLIYDLKGGFGTLRKYNALYEAEEQSGLPKSLWDGNEVVQTQPSIAQSDYQKSLDAGIPPAPLTSSNVRYWSDFNRVFYHPRSIVQLNDYELNSALMPFEDWRVGEDLFRDLDKEHDLLDRDLRLFAEECDQLRALQIFTASDDAWGGFAARYIDRIKDEYGKTGIWVWALEDGSRVSQPKQFTRTTNTARSLYNMISEVSIYCPIKVPPQKLPAYVSMEAHSPWYTSALVASALETVTLPARLRPYRDFETALAGESGGSHKIFELQSTVDPHAPQIQSTGITGDFQSTTGTDVEAKTNFDINFSNNNANSESACIFSQMQVIRGLLPEPAEKKQPLDEPGLIRKLRTMNSQPIVERFTTELQFPILDSFPQNLLPRPGEGSSLTISAALSATSKVRDTILELENVARRVVGVDERETLVNGLEEIREAYEQGWLSDADSGDD